MSKLKKPTKFGAGVAALAIAATLTSVAITQRANPSGHVGVHVVDLPKKATKTKKKDVKILLETPRLKIAAISLRGGTVLAAHSAPLKSPKRRGRN